MPRTPKRKRQVVVVHAADHVFRRIDAVQQAPETEEAPRNKELEPDDVEVEQTYHRELERRVALPRLGLGNRHHVHEMQKKLHHQDAKEEPQAVDGCAQKIARRLEREVVGLVHVVVEGDDGPANEQRRISQVGAIVGKRVVLQRKQRREAAAVVQVGRHFPLLQLVAPFQVVQGEREHAEQREVVEDVPPRYEAREQERERPVAGPVIEEERQHAVRPQTRLGRPCAAHTRRQNVHHHHMD